jgi:hypothetical protein
MFGDAGTADTAPLDSRALTAVIPRLTELRTDVSDAERIDQIRALEELKAAAAAAQARITVDLDTTERASQAAAGVPTSQQGRGVAGLVALARRESAFRGNQHLGLAKVLVAEMPHTLAALEHGLISEWRATLLVRETACLSIEHRQLIDAGLAANPLELEGWGDRRLVAEIQKMACQLDVASIARRRARAESERRVTCRPAPDTMALLSALLPVAQGVAVHASLRREADTHIAAGDPRTRGQIMADTLVARVTGQASATAVPVQINLIMSGPTLFGDGGDDDGDSDQPAHLSEFGPIPADLARRLAATATEAEIAWLRRLYATPDTGELIAMESKRRLFPAGLARFIRIRDQFCRTPWCDAPIRHADHALPSDHGGATSADNGQGLCAQCNHNRQAPGWQAQPRADIRHTLRITTPTGHSYITTAPRPPGTPLRTRRRGPDIRSRRHRRRTGPTPPPPSPS